MPTTTTRVEAITIDGDDGSSTTFRNDGDLVVDFKKMAARSAATISASCWSRSGSTTSGRSTKSGWMDAYSSTRRWSW